MIDYFLRDIDDGDYELSGAGIAQPARGSVTFLKIIYK